MSDESAFWELVDLVTPVGPWTCADVAEAALEKDADVCREWLFVHARAIIASAISDRENTRTAVARRQAKRIAFARSADIVDIADAESVNVFRTTWEVDGQRIAVGDDAGPIPASRGDRRRGGCVMGAFDKYRDVVWPHRFEADLIVYDLQGGTPVNPETASGWLKTKLAASDDLIREMVAEIMVEREITMDEAVSAAAELKTVSAFRRDRERGLYIEGRQVKAMLKEAASVAATAGNLEKSGWGKVSGAKGVQSFVAEHIMVADDRIYLGVNEADGVRDGFVHKNAGKFSVHAMKSNEYVTEAKISLTVVSDWDFTEAQWAAIWLTGGMQGLGANRSQGCGRFEVMRWERSPA